MIHIDFTNDAPMVETVEGEGFVRIDTASAVNEPDHVSFEKDGSRADLDADATAMQRTTIKTAAGPQVVELRLNERDLPDYGVYEVKCITRRRQQRVYAFEIVRGDDPDTVKFVVDPKTTPCAWVTESDVYQTSKTDKVTIPASLGHGAG